MAGPRIKLDFAALAAKTVDTGAALKRSRGSEEYVPSPFAEMLAKSKASGTSLEIPIPTPGPADSWFETVMDENGKTVLKDDGQPKTRRVYDATVARAEYNAIVGILRKDAKVQGIGVRVAEVFELQDDDETEHLVGVEFQGKNMRGTGEDAPAAVEPAPAA